MDYGKKWLKLLEQWKTLEDAFNEISKDDEALHMRQVAMMDSAGNIFAHTWSDCVKYADYIVWDEFVVQGNLLTNQDVLPAMKKAYEDNINTDFAQRLYLCIKAWEEAGWELRWVQSAALRVVSWDIDQYDIINLRIDNSENPLEQMWWQLDISVAYSTLMKAEEEWDTWDINKSLKLFDKVFRILWKSEEALFWKAFMLQNNWKESEAEEIFKQFPENSKWSELRARIS